MRKSLIYISIVVLLALSGAGSAQELLPWDEVPCSDPIYVNPGETIILNGTAVPPVTDPETEVNYAWAFWDSGDNPYGIYDYLSPFSLITQPHNGAFLNFSAPVEEGCYKALLTVWFHRTVSTEGEEDLFEDCISQDCFEICVNASACALCDDIFCSGDEPTTEACPNNMCFENWTEGLLVYWNVTLRSDGSEVSSQEGECAEFDWANKYGNDTYLLNMSVYGPLDYQGARAFYYSCTGNVSKVETPVAEIRRE
jgi:hypothetical protein